MNATALLPVGAHTFIWTPRWDRRGARRAATQTAAAGFDFVEIPLLDPTIVDIADTIRVLDDTGLSCTCSLGLPANAHLPQAPDKAVAFLTGAIDVAADLGSQWLTGALYGSLGTNTGAPPTDHELDTVARVLHQAASHAADRGIKLGIEIINRYETYLVNTANQAIDLLDRIDASNVYAHLDTYHMNIEESSFSEPIHRLGPRLGYVHLAESHRGIIGQGHTPFHDIFAALYATNFSGPLVIEAFLNTDATIQAITATWTHDRTNPQQFAGASLAHITRTQQSIWGSAES